jgi:hypothetical protein
MGLIGSLFMGKGGEESVDVNEVLEDVPGLEGGPSEGGFSWHTLESCMKCWRLAYFQHVQGLVPKTHQKALAFGTLYHACWELWYRFGGQRRYDEPCDVVRQAGAPKLAGEVQRLVYAQLQHFAQEEAAEWDIRDVEANALFWMEPERINGKTVQVPICCRHDLIIGKHAPGAPCAPPGPVPDGVLVVDHKTCGNLGYDTTKGYGQDGQFLTNALVFMRSDEPERYGHLKGIIVTAAAKHKEPSARSFFRIETSADVPAIEEFYHMEIRPYALELYRRLVTKEIRENRNAWPKNRSQCVGRYGCCRFFDICDVGGDNLLGPMFKVDARRILSVDKLAEPPMEVKRAQRAQDPKKQASEEARKQKIAVKKHHAGLLLKAFAEAAQTMEIFDSTKYLVPGHTERGVMNQLVETLKTTWEVGFSFDFGPDVEGQFYIMDIREKSIGWLLKQEEAPAEPVEEEVQEKGKRKRKKKKGPPPIKGTLSYKGVAEAICQNWWDLSKLTPGG